MLRIEYMYFEVDIDGMEPSKRPYVLMLLIFILKCYETLCHEKGIFSNNKK